MSQMEFHYGRMKEVILPDNKNIEDFCKENSKSTELKSYNKNWIEQFIDENSDYRPGNFLIHNDKIFEIIEHYEDNDNEYYMKLIDNTDGSITFIGSFYNGGTDFTEMIEEELDTKNNNK